MDDIRYTFPGIELLEKLGEGKLTEFWKARQVSLDRLVSIRLLKPHAAANPEERRIFLDDARQASDLQHTGIVQIYDVFQHEGLCYFVMEHVGGPTVLDLLEQGRVFPVDESMRIAAGVADALRYAWAQSRKVHKNIKPSSVRFDVDGRIKVAYLGLSLRPPQVLRAPDGTLVIEGTPHYMAPEQAAGKPFDFRADMYALGMLLYHMLTGHVPFGDCDAVAAMRRQIGDSLPHPGDLGVKLPVGALNVLKRLLMKNPDDRFSSWEQAISALHMVARGRIVIAKTRLGARGSIAAPRVRVVARRRLA